MQCGRESFRRRGVSQAASGDEIWRHFGGDARCNEKTLEIVRGSLGEYRVLVVAYAVANVTDLLLEVAICAAAGDSAAVARIFTAGARAHQQRIRAKSSQWAVL